MFGNIIDYGVLTFLFCAGVGVFVLCAAKAFEIIERSEGKEEGEDGKTSR